MVKPFIFVFSFLSYRTLMEAPREILGDLDKHNPKINYSILLTIQIFEHSGYFSVLANHLHVKNFQLINSSHYIPSQALLIVAY